MQGMLCSTHGALSCNVSQHPISRQQMQTQLQPWVQSAPGRSFPCTLVGGRTHFNRSLDNSKARVVMPQAISYRASTFAPREADVPHGPPALMSRHISLNPLESVAMFVDHSFHQLDLFMASVVDKRSGLTWAAVALNGIATVTGLSLYQQLGSGQPLWLRNVLEDNLGELLMKAPQLLLLLASLPLALWHLRTWWEANTEAARELVGGPPSSALTTTAVWVAISRLAIQAAAMSAALSPDPMANFAAAGLLLVSVLPLAAAAFTSAGAEARQPQQAAECLQAAAPLLLPLLAGDALLLAAAAASAAAAAAAALGAAFAAALAAVVLQKRYADRLHAYRASVGDAAEVHISVRADFGALIDTSAGKEPLRVTVGEASTRFGAAAARSCAEAAPESQPQPEAQASTSASSASISSSPPAAATTAAAAAAAPSTDAASWSWSAAGALDREVAKGTRRFQTPFFAQLMDDLLPGLVLGERTSVTVFNPVPKDGGFVNPDLVWWQSLEDMEKKFKAKGLPGPGQVFWYPLGPGPNDNWAPVRVNEINETYAELNGNESIEGAAMVVELHLMSLHKQHAAH